MNRNEFNFYKKLDLAFGVDYKILPQVHLDELVKPKQFSGSRLFSFRHINQKSVDFLLCDKYSLAPKIALELDGPSHLMQKTKERDVEVERILKEVNLPLIRFNNDENLSLQQIKQRVTQGVTVYT